MKVRFAFAKWLIAALRLFSILIGLLFLWGSPAFDKALLVLALLIDFINDMRE